MPSPSRSGPTRAIATATAITTTPATVAVRVLAVGALALGTLLLTTAGPAHADTTATGSGGQRLTVSKSTGVSRSGETVTVNGTGYDTSKGIYVSFCVDNGAGAAPSPCGGGADMSGTSGSSHWISSNPPAYGEGLAVPYGSGGSFQVSVPVVTRIGDVDCTVRVCSVVTRADHTRTSDRSQDVRVPIQFAASAPPAAPTTTGTRAPTGTDPDPAPTRATTGSGGTTGTSGTTGPAGADATDATPGTASDGPADSGTTGGGSGQRSDESTHPGASDLAVTRVSSVGSAGQWWSSTLILLALGVIALIGLSAARRRRAGGSRP